MGADSKIGFSDYASYVEEFSNEFVSKRELYQLSGLKQFFSFEVLWDELVRAVARLTGDASVALHFSPSSLCRLGFVPLFRRTQFGIALLFLFNPTAIDVAMSIIRNGLAWSLVIIGMSARSKAVRFSLFFVAIFIHSSTLVLLIIYGLPSPGDSHLER